MKASRKLIYFVWSVFLGWAMIYIFPHIQMLLAPIFVNVGKEIFTHTENSLLVFLFNLLYSSFVAIPICIVGILISKYLFKITSITFCLPVSVVVIGVSYWSLSRTYGEEAFKIYSVYPAELINPLVIAALFSTLFWLFVVKPIKQNGE